MAGQLTTKANTQAHWWQRLTSLEQLFVVLCITCGVVVLMLLALHIRQLTSDAAVKSVVTKELASAQIADNAIFTQQVNALHQYNLVGQMLGASKVDVCYLNHDDQGFGVKNWYQKCYLRYVEGFATSLSQAEARQRLAAIPNVAALFGEPGLLGCDIYDRNYVPSVEFRGAGQPINVAQDDGDCNIPDQLQGVMDIDPIILDNELTAKAFSSFDPGKVGNATNQIWLMYSRNYYTENLGCAGLLCGQPRDAPITAH